VRLVNGLRPHKHTAASANAKIVTSAFFSALKKIISLCGAKIFRDEGFLATKRHKKAHEKVLDCYQVSVFFLDFLWLSITAQRVRQTGLDGRVGQLNLELLAKLLVAASLIQTLESCLIGIRPKRRKRRPD